MNNPKPEPPRWIANLRAFMEARQFNPRSLSLRSGLNPTAIRDMLEGRTRFPRYDTVLAIATALDITPTQLMGENANISQANQSIKETDDDLELLTEIITRLQETAEDYQHKLNPRDFAAMVTTIYRRVRKTPTKKAGDKASLHPQIHDLIAYESLRRRSRG